MNIRTEITIPESLVKIDYQSNFYSIGSCFAENIGRQLHDLKFRVENNPMGTVFNPITIFDQIEHLADPSRITEELITEKEGVFYHYQYYHHLFSKDKSDLLNDLKAKVNYKKEAFLKSNVLIITLGTAFVHELRDSNKVIGNCHKQNASLFQKRKLSLTEILNSFDRIHPLITHFDKIILTVSPVRHTKEGLSENQWSKSLLRVACEELKERYNNIEYFPSYEILMDDLRDYRWYESDMIHPNNQSQEYIFKLFCDTFLSQEAKESLQKVRKLNLALNHKVMIPNSLEHKKLLESRLKQINNLPHYISFELEKEQTLLELGNI